MKCIVSWCPDDGLERGALPGLCAQHRDETLAKQREATTVVKRDFVHASPDVFTVDDIDRGDFKPAAAFFPSCVKCGSRGSDVCPQMPQVVKNGTVVALLSTKTMLCNACVLKMEQETGAKLVL